MSSGEATRMVAEPGRGMEVWYSSLPGRQESSGSGQQGIQRNRDGVPIWGGDPSLLEEFTEACLRYEQTIVREKRYLCGPRIASELTGPAKRVLIGRPADWLSFEGGVRHLIEALRSERGQPQVPEMSELLMKYFKGTRRQKGESMNDYVTRKAEAYTRAQQSMARYHQSAGGQTSRGMPASSQWRRHVPPSMASERPAPDQGPEPSSVSTPGEASQEQYEDAQEQPNVSNTGGPDDAWSTGQNWGTQGWWSHNWYGGWYNQWRGGYGQWNNAWHRAGTDTTEWDRHSLPEILPDFIQGWYLFVDSGLDVMERNVLQAELRGDFSVRAVENVLRKHWTDHDIRKRDQEKGRYLANVAESLEAADEEAMACVGEWDQESLVAEGYSGEEIEVLAAEHEKACEAYAMIQEGKRTLKDARARQHAVKMARQYYPVKAKMVVSGTNGANRNSELKCFRCGGAHKIAFCPEKPKEKAPVLMAQGEDEQAPLVFLAEAFSAQATGETASMDDSGTMDGQHGFLTTAEVVEQGKAVIDGGATRTIGSIYALSKVTALNEQKTGHDGVHSVDMSDRPSFGFGNSDREQCASTACIEVPLNGQQSLLKVHALDKGTAPVLMSIHSLRRLGAVVDFEKDLAVFRHVDDRSVVQLERTSAGHQVLPLTEDAFQGAVKLDKPIRSLHSLV